jgi:hypothetical protein
MIRVNELARQLEVKSREVIDKLHELGIAEKVTHSSSISDDKADQLRRYYGGESHAPLPPRVGVLGPSFLSLGGGRVPPPPKPAIFPPAKPSSIVSGTEAVFAAAQRPGGVSGTLMSLVPLRIVSGQGIDPRDFPPAGLVFWNANNTKEQDLVPGTIFIGALIESRANGPNLHRFTVMNNTIRRPTPEEFTEVIEMGEDVGGDITACFTPDSPLVMDHKPTPSVLVLGRGSAYGPLGAVSWSENDRYRVMLIDSSINEFVFEAIRSVLDQNSVTATANVTDEANDPRRARSTHSISYRFLLAQGTAALREAASNARTIVSPIGTLGTLLASVADEPELQKMDRFLNKLAAARDLRADSAALIESIRATRTLGSKRLEETADALFRSGLFESQLNRVRGATAGPSAEELERLRLEHERLSRHNELLKHRIDKVLHRLTDDGDALVADFLATVPLLGTYMAMSISTASTANGVPQSPLQFPPGITGRASSREIKETEYLERLKKFSEACNFR